MRCRCILTPVPTVDCDRVEVRNRLRALLGDRQAPSKHEAPPERRAEAADLFREICADHGPYEIAAAVGAPLEVGDDLRLIAYLFAASVCESDVRDACVESGRVGFEEHLARSRA